MVLRWVAVCLGFRRRRRSLGEICQRLGRQQLERGEETYSAESKGSTAMAGGL